MDNLETTSLHPIHLVGDQLVTHYRIFPFQMKDGILALYTDVHENHDRLDELELVLNKQVILQQIESSQLDELIAKHYRIENNPTGQTINFSDDFLSIILQKAITMGSSDIHFESFEHLCRIRFRLDGKLVEQYKIDVQEYPSIVNRIKIQSSMDISEKRLPQDGRMQTKVGLDHFDLRVSTLPTLHGEKLVLRILSKTSGAFTLEEIGFSNFDLNIFKEALKKPHGIILVSGPTGSGKTTTLYACLKALNTQDRNILTIEDPIEYTLEGINQVQLKTSIGLDFPNALRTFLRQDPDVIMVGEIRDEKTAQMAIRAALTGHLVLSTIHTNSAWATITRLADMNIQPFLIANTLNMSVAQRLIRKLCPKCKQKQKVSYTDFPSSFQPPQNLTSIYVSKGCNYCFQTGYKGRKALYEIIPITREVIPFIKKKELHIDSYLASKGIRTLKDKALETLMEGTTSLEEVFPILSE